MNVPEIPSAFSDIIGFGPVEQVYSVRRASKWGNAVATLLLLICTFVFIVIGISNMSTSDNAWPFLAFAGFLFLVAVYTLWLAVSNWKKCAVVYQQGFAYNDRKGLVTCLWNEIESIKSNVVKHYTNGIYSGTTHTYTIDKKDETRLVLNDSLVKVEQLFDCIREHSFESIYQRYSSVYNSGVPISFGPITISRSEGISIGRKNFAWDQVASVSIQKGAISVAKKGGGWFSNASVQSSQIPNLGVMLSIINQVIDVQVPGK
jgi:hypothetical protein